MSYLGDLRFGKLFFYYYLKPIHLKVVPSILRWRQLYVPFNCYILHYVVQNMMIDELFFKMYLYMEKALENYNNFASFIKNSYILYNLF